MRMPTRALAACRKVRARRARHAWELTVVEAGRGLDSSRLAGLEGLDGCSIDRRALLDGRREVSGNAVRRHTLRAGRRGGHNVSSSA